MKRLYTCLIFILFCSSILRAQDYLPFASGNYAGVTGISLQPASIADSRYKIDIAIASESFGFSNTFYGIDPYVLIHPKLLSDLDFQGPYFSRTKDGKDKSAIITSRTDIMSTMVTLSPHDAIGFNYSLRGIVNIDNMTESLAFLLDGLDKETDLWHTQLTNEDLNGQMNAWAEWGITYARVIMDNKEHFLKAGATLKINQGLGAAYMFMKNLNYEVNGEDTVSFYNSYTNYGTSDNLDENFRYRFDANPSLSFDLGVVYEYRPQWMKYKYDLDGETNLWRKDLNKYLFRVGITLSDIGTVRYRRNPDSRDFNADIHNLYTGDLDINSITDFNNFIDSTFTYYDVPDKYNMRLPASLNLQADVRIAEGFYLNVNPYLALNRGTKTLNKVYYLSAINFVPRYEKAWWGVSLPVQYNANKQWSFGLGLRMGPVWFGWNDIFSLLTSQNNRYGTALSVGLKVPVLYAKPKDRDGDKVSDKKDLCPDLAGNPASKGCPDADLDGINDDLDQCPNVPGIKALNGCPDTDGDGIPDHLDLCPDMKGLQEFKGCPDSDGDSIPDQNDACPYNAGPASLQGCPDQDGDGIPDKDDNCPTVAGTRENRGCPFVDNDGDGIPDDKDRCPMIKGPADNSGCPYDDTDLDSIPDKDDDCPTIAGSRVFRGCPDTDGDGISDKYDICPTLPGVPQNNGCPEIKKEEQDILRKAFDNLEFETGKAVIRSSSLGSLDELARVMYKRPEFKLLLAGHTDNVGNADANMTLSKNRTLAVKKYLVKNGIAEERIRTEWYGQNKPVASNSTAEGRQMNRRVEMSIVFE
jgi:outer membrane protein OmpA-like peptidoglycan-associated protein